MFNIKTFIKKPGVKIVDLSKVQINPEIYFINIVNSGEIKKTKQDLDIFSGKIVSRSVFNSA